MSYEVTPEGRVIVDVASLLKSEAVQRIAKMAEQIVALSTGVDEGGGVSEDSFEERAKKALDDLDRAVGEAQFKADYRIEVKRSPRRWSWLGEYWPQVYYGPAFYTYTGRKFRTPEAAMEHGRKLVAKLKAEETRTVAEERIQG